MGFAGSADIFEAETENRMASLEYVWACIIHPNLMDIYVGFRWFTGQIVHFLATRRNAGKSLWIFCGAKLPIGSKIVVDS